MSIKDDIVTDQSAVADAQIALDTANVKLAADEAKLAAIQPHLTLLDQLEADLAAVDANVDAAMQSALDGYKASIEPFIAAMRALFLG